jgi:O-acetyl-ADP-ribose deacetylase (regulator of RNase III)
MIEIRKSGDIFTCGTHAIVNPINCVGTMGAGLALAFKQRYPQMFRFYKEACDNKEIRVGEMWAWRDSRLETILLADGRTIIEPEWIINFPTKDKWQNPSKLDWISDGLDDLKRHVTIKRIESLAIPALGCGKGGLPFDIVQSLIVERLEELTTQIILFEPQ